MIQNEQWVKSTYSSGNGCCVEAAFRKSSHSAYSTECVDVATCDCDGPVQEVLVRHSKHPDGPMVIYTRGEWLAFIQGVKDGEFDI